MNVELGQMVALALLIEALWENCKMVWQDGKFSWDRAGALLLSVALCALSGANLFAAVGLPIGAHMVGCLLTGVLVSRGSNFLHDLIEKVRP